MLFLRHFRGSGEISYGAVRCDAVLAENHTLCTIGTLGRKKNTRVLSNITDIDTVNILDALPFLSPARIIHCGKKTEFSFWIHEMVLLTFTNLQVISMEDPQISSYSSP